MENNALTIKRESLRDINQINVDISLGKAERIKQFVNQIGNPCCYLDNGTVVKISFSDSDVTLEDRLKAYINSIS